MRPQKVRCGVCGHVCSIQLLLSTSAFGSTDLDTRPPALERYTLDVQIHECPSCGLAAPELQAPDGAALILKEPAYRRLLEDAAYPALARRYLCWALICQRTGALADATWSAIRAAWVCDERRRWKAAARPCRLRAIELLRQAEAAGQSVIEGQGASHALLADLQRRSSQAEDARLSIELGLAANPESPLKEVLLYQRELIEMGDEGAHTVMEAMKRFGNER